MILTSPTNYQKTEICGGYDIDMQARGMRNNALKHVLLVHCTRVKRPKGPCTPKYDQI